MLKRNRMKNTTMKKKMSHRAFKAWWIVCISIIAVLTIIINAFALQFAPMLDSFLGAGKTVVKRVKGSENWDAQYYKTKYDSNTQAVQHSLDIAEQVSDEGIVLLKNDGALPLKEKSTVTPYGYGYLHPAYSGTGAAATTSTDNVTVEQGLSKYFKVDKSVSEFISKQKASYPDADKDSPALDYDKGSLQAKNDAGKSARIYEYTSDIYEKATKSVASNSAAVVFIMRNGSEGADKRQYAYEDGTPHYLALSQAEKDMISTAKKHHASVTVVLNTSNPMEISELMTGDYEVNALVWMGIAGARGFASLGKILSGRVNPSGRLTDIYATDFTQDPTYANFGQYGYSNVNYEDTTLITQGAQQPWPFVEYEEGIYVGYKYYETADKEDSDFVYGTRDAFGSSTQVGAVAYPFGYGLSYTSFNQELESVTYDSHSNDKTVTVQVKVTNTGTVAGKEVVQLYATSPYTDYDREHGVEKAATQLVDFSKTGLLQPGESEIVPFTFTVDDLSSYDRVHENADGTKGAYLLEAGDYVIDLKKNSHDMLDSSHITVESTTWFEGDNPTSSDKSGQSLLDTHGHVTDKSADKNGYKAAHNQFQDLSDYMQRHTTQLSRANWHNTQPTAPENREAEASDDVIAALKKWKNFDVEHDPDLGNNSKSKVYANSQPVSGQVHGLSLIDLRGVSYDDPKWDKLMDQLDFNKDKKEIQQLLYMAAYQTEFIPSLGKPLTVDKDGAMGWSTAGSSSWASANVMASTFNTELMTTMGEAFGEEALHQGLTGWYAPAINIHRSPFGGRVYEYFSEDAVLSGKLAAAAISGAGNKGIISYLKHFAINDQETNRSNYMATWANEQTVREIYLQPFRIAIQSARSELPYLTDKGAAKTKTIRSATAIMSAQNNIGAINGFARYSLLTNVLRNEWGFDGAVVTDMFMETNRSARDLSMRAGSDMYMIQIPGYSAVDYDSATARWAMRRAVKNIAYATVNSNAMNGITPQSKVYKGLSPWQTSLWVADIVTLVLIASIIIMIIRRGRKVKRNPEAYKQPKRRNKKQKA
ncbi:glycoside hydrolase family 3 C-terminal domain-containing protein [Alloscardovia omnicolens]|uniref:glycoside hydrolase family 3 C-terminal domain-containing protein n=1 Tax=Alloscardovia omnicolens TaxID=419015 RepID=UPI003A64F2D1